MLPDNVLVKISEILAEKEHKGTLSALIQTNSHYYTLLVPFLYEHVTLDVEDPELRVADKALIRSLRSYNSYYVKKISIGYLNKHFHSLEFPLLKHVNILKTFDYNFNRIQQFTSLNAVYNNLSIDANFERMYAFLTNEYGFRGNYLEMDHPINEITWTLRPSEPTKDENILVRYFHEVLNSLEVTSINLHVYRVLVASSPLWNIVNLPQVKLQTLTIDDPSLLELLDASKKKSISKLRVSGMTNNVCLSKLFPLDLPNLKHLKVPEDWILEGENKWRIHPLIQLILIFKELTYLDVGVIYGKGIIDFIRKRYQDIKNGVSIRAMVVQYEYEKHLEQLVRKRDSGAIPLVLPGQYDRIKNLLGEKRDRHFKAIDAFEQRRDKLLG